MAGLARVGERCRRIAVDRERFGMAWNQFGMIRGHATVTASLRFTRVTS
jgi:hypothetical protein